MNDFTGRVRWDERKPPKGFTRTYVLALDPAQYQLDVTATAAGTSPDVYNAFNLLLRRDAKENNFKAVLESIRDSLNEQLVIPEWLVDIFLGYGDAGAAHYTQMDGLLKVVDFKDTFLDAQHVLYHNCPGQRTLLITHSNQALNDLFAKLASRDIPARYLLRLGMGERDLDVEDDFSRAGRVNNMLARRIRLLAEVEKLGGVLGLPPAEHTCETAGYFWLLHVLSRWEKFTAALSAPERAGQAAPVGELFPFKDYFADAPQPLFKGSSFEEDMEVARGCFRHLRQLFQELEETRPFELLKGQADRVSYLCTKQAKVVAMTCTHAALKRREFLKLGLKYDNILMEEAGQVLEVETFIPMVLQRQEDGVARLKRVVLIGDHHQLPPVVQNMAFQKYSHLDQSLFARFIRLGTPYVELNAQGEAFLAANPGFAFDYQLINVPDFKGRGESEPAPYYYQNLGEAEYVVALFSMMRLLGYPASKISILTTYNGQKDLIRDVVEARARLGLYVFGRQELFENCYELAPAFSRLLQRPTQ
eukprot:gene14486-14606_t